MIRKSHKGQKHTVRNPLKKSITTVDMSAKEIKHTHTRTGASLNKTAKNHSVEKTKGQHRHPEKSAAKR